MSMPLEQNHDPQVHYDLGFAYAEMGLYEDAISELKLALKLAPKHRKHEEAFALLNELLEHQGTRADPGRS